MNYSEFIKESANIIALTCGRDYFIGSDFDNAIAISVRDAQHRVSLGLVPRYQPSNDDLVRLARVRGAGVSRGVRIKSVRLAIDHAVLKMIKNGNELTVSGIARVMGVHRVSLQQRHSDHIKTSITTQKRKVAKRG